MGPSEHNNISRRLEKLTPAQRALLERSLLERRGSAARRQSIGPRDGDGPAPVSYAQELLWLLSQVFDDGIAYNAPGAYQLKGPLDVAVLARALTALTERHAILRTTYRVIADQPVQVVGPVTPVQLNIVDLVGRPPDEQQPEVARILKREARHRFDLEMGPVMRPTVIRLAADEHVLMLNMHHIATDGYSRGAIYRDLTALYDALSKDEPSPLAPLPIQYADYAVWQRGWLDRGSAGTQLEYWQGKLAGAPSRLDLPTDFARPPLRSWVGDHMSSTLEIPTREALRAVGRQGNATLFVAMLAVFGVLLGRYSGQEDIVVGTPFAGRNRSELESMVGYFINPLALRLDLSGDPTFAELVRRVRETTIEAFAHADVPYESVVRAINPERDLSQTPVFQAMMVFHNPAWQTNRPKFEPDGIRCVELSHEKGWAKFDVLVGMSERAAGLNTTWEYSTELFRASTVQRMMEHFRILAESAGANAHRPLSRLSMLSESERTQVLFAYNGRSEPVADEPTVKELFEAQARRAPEAPAVVFADQRQTYAELNGRANRIAWMLRERGVGPGVLVAILMEKALDLPAAVLGVLKAGGAYVPLDPMYPDHRLEFMLADAAPRLVLTHSGLASVVPAHIEHIAVDELGGLVAENCPTVAGGDDLAYVSYTSGSTGEPKGAMIANRSLTSAFYAWERAYRLPELHAHAQLASFSFDVFTGDLVRALLSGAKLVLCPFETVVDPGALYDVIVGEGIDAAEFVPATASLLFEWAQREGRRLETMRLVVVGSEAWRNEKYWFFESLCGPETRLINSYGLTEATIDSTYFESSPGTDLLPGRFVPIGRPLANTEVYIVDTNLEPQPVGIVGELCVGGVAVARGYLGRPELTAARFVPDPFASEMTNGFASLLYRTGDLARWLPDGSIDFLGRVDRQIKIRGFRIEPGEIEAILERHPDVRCAAVVDRIDARGEKRLVAYVEGAAEEPDVAGLRSALTEYVPAYMVPSAYVIVDELPYTPNGKLAHDALPAPDWDQARAGEAFVAPRTETERRLAEIWSTLLGVADIGVGDNFFALGGHSLLAMQLMSRVREELGSSLSLRAVFDAPTIAALAGEVERAPAVAQTAQAPALVKVRRPSADLPGRG